MNGRGKLLTTVNRPLSGWVALAAVALPLWGGAALGQTATDNETRLRDALRTATSQLRTLEDERVGLQARAVQAEQQAETLRAQLQAATEELKKVSAQLGDRDQALTEAGQQIAAQIEAREDLRQTLDKWKIAYDEAANVARTKEAERARLSTELAAFTKRATTCEALNAELFKVGNEILGRYAAVDLSDVMALREPFIGVKRVELQNIVQDYQDKLLDGKVTP
jgi:chromosome segregation ATPase